MKVGRFIIPATEIRKGLSNKPLLTLMSRVIVLRAEMLYVEEGIEYTAISEYFEEVGEGNRAPRYIFTFSRDLVQCEKVKIN